ncbi:MAG: polysaccharide biosynthesis tyrosine autokinase [Flavobacterium sp.]|nr:polysaccharide biosynthesis tyrosine autokinase [Flavobacterium sp.]
MEENTISSEKIEQDFNIKALLSYCLVQWKWFLLSVFICLSLAFIYIRYYTSPSFQASTTIMLKDEKGTINPELNSFSDIGLISNINNNINSEIEILKSRTLFEKTVKKLNLNLTLLVKGKILNTELFQNPPIIVSFSNVKNSFYSASFELKFSEINQDTFALSNDLENGGKIVILNKKRQYKYGDLIKTKYGYLTINKSEERQNSYRKENRNISIVVSPLDQVVSSFRNRIKIAPSPTAAGFVSVSIVDNSIAKAETFLNNYIQIYNEDAIIQKNIIIERSSDFISKRLLLVTQELDGVEQNVESFKRSNNLLDVESESSRLTEESNEYDRKLDELDMQLELIPSLVDYVKKSTYVDLLPNNLIAGQSDVSSLINSFNQLVNDRNRLLKSATDTNPAVIKIEQQINSVKQNLTSSLNRFQSSLRNQKSSLNEDDQNLDEKIIKIPVMERQFKVISRQQKVKEGLYLYLLQKREESAVYLSATISNARIIDKPKALLVPVSPNKNTIYLAAFIFGLFLPFSVFYLIDLLDNKVKSRFDLEEKTKIPFVGDLPKSDSPNEIMKSESRSSSAEALRIISTNLRFMLSNVPEGLAKTIFLTSTFPKEGKTFVSLNLAATFALTGKKVLLLSMDIRNPKLEEYILLPDDRGVTNYLSSKDLKIEDLIVKQEGFNNFDILPPGIIPPNPAELLMGDKVDNLFKELKLQYDYIIVDTSPVSLVTDTLLLAKYADCFVYLVRANFLEKGMLHIPNTLYTEKKLPNMCMLLNDTNPSKGSYGYYGYYGYGYGYGNVIENKSWLKKIFKV